VISLYKYRLDGHKPSGMPDNLTLGRIRLHLREWAGTVLNLVGLPGFVRACDDRAESAKTEITVRVVGMLTIISVNGVDIYFHRLADNIK
jgi:hypothetical protein